VLLSRVFALGGSVEVLRKEFGDPDSLSQRLRELEPRLAVEGREGENELRLAAIDRIAHELFPTSQSVKSGKTTRRRKPAPDKLF
jgi:hypothetical protein